MSKRAMSASVLGIEEDFAGGVGNVEIAGQCGVHHGQYDFAFAEHGDHRLAEPVRSVAGKHAEERFAPHGGLAEHAHQSAADGGAHGDPDRRSENGGDRIGVLRLDHMRRRDRCDQAHPPWRQHREELGNHEIAPRRFTASQGAGTCRAHYGWQADASGPSRLHDDESTSTSIVAIRTPAGVTWSR
jgi:hypothetical protein